MTSACVTSPACRKWSLRSCQLVSHARLPTYTLVPGAAAPTPADLRLLASRLIHLHVKDAVRLTAPKPGEHIAVGTPVGVGEVDWRAHFRVLRELGYGGLLSLETHWRLEKIDESLLHLPAGHAFSHGGETASRTCLHNLRALLET